MLVQNPNNKETKVTVTHMTNTGPLTKPPFTMPARSRKTIRVNDYLPNLDLSTQVHGEDPIIAERAMYWDNGTGEATHDSIGLAHSHLSFLMPDGQTSEGHETWTLVQNPNGTPVTVEISYLTPMGTGNQKFTSTVPANSRKTYDMVEKIADSRASVRVDSTSAGMPIMVERSMYWNNRGVGTDTIGGYTD